MQRTGSSAQGGRPQPGEDPDWSLPALGGAVSPLQRGKAFGWASGLWRLLPAADGQVALKAVPMALSSTHSHVAELGC